MGRKGQVRERCGKGGDEPYIFFLHCEPHALHVCRWCQLNASWAVSDCTCTHTGWSLPTHSSCPRRKTPPSSSTAGLLQSARSNGISGFEGDSDTPWVLLILRATDQKVSNLVSKASKETAPHLCSLLKALQSDNPPYPYSSAAYCSPDRFLLLWVSEGTGSSIWSSELGDILEVPLALPCLGTPVGQEWKSLESDGHIVSLPPELTAQGRSQPWPWPSGPARLEAVNCPASLWPQFLHTLRWIVLSPLPLGPCCCLFPLTIIVYIQNSNVSLHSRCL